MIVTLILDAPVAFVPNESRSGSLLSMPLGQGTVLEYLAEEISRTVGDQVFILGSPETDASRRTLQWGQTRSDVLVVGFNEFAALVKDLEPSDRLLLVDARHWPSEGLDFSALVRGDEFLGATHVVAMGSETDGTVERLQYDERGQVQCVRRLYHQVTQVEGQRGIISYSLVPAPAIQGMTFASLSELRVSMVSRGVLSRDLPITSDLIDLTTEQGLLAANEQVLATIADAELRPEYSKLSRGVLLGRGALVAESVNIIPPVIIQPGVIIEENVKIVGPSLIGAHSTIQRGAVIAQALVPRGSHVSAGAAVRHSVGVTTPLKPRLNEAPQTGGFVMSSEESFGDSDGASASKARLKDRIKGRPAFRAIKRTTDVVVAALALILLFPLLVIVAILIKLESRGPVFFVHYREGVEGKPFGCLKFRTMCADAHQQQRELYEQNVLDGPQFKLPDDPRVTRFGRFLRATNIDEIPQLINVLLGRMSLVGPRPSPFRENQICVPWRRARLSVRPGITGLWQVCRSRRRAGDFQQWIFYDILYVRHMSVWLDFKILLATNLTAGGKWSIPLSYLIPPEESHANAAEPLSGVADSLS